MADERLIVALDFARMADAEALVEKLGDAVSFYKVGMELFYGAGTPAVKWLKEKGKRVFLDLKLHDIPNTVASSLCPLMELGADIVNIHAAGGFEMMRRAAEKSREYAASLGISRPKLIAVTVLTSVDETEWKKSGETMSIAEAVLRRALLAKEAGLDGVVSSPKEAAQIKNACGGDFLIVTPGVRPAGAAANDQSRVASPGDALKNGATHIVVGRPIRGAANPRDVALEIIKEMEAVK